MDVKELDLRPDFFGESSAVRGAGPGALLVKRALG